MQGNNCEQQDSRVIQPKLSCGFVVKGTVSDLEKLSGLIAQCDSIRVIYQRTSGSNLYISDNNPNNGGGQ